MDGAVLPIENSLHGSVAEHYDLLLELPVRIERESLLRIRHNVIAMPGVKLEEVRRVMSHPVASVAVPEISGGASGAGGGAVL